MHAYLLITKTEDLKSEKITKLVNLKKFDLVKESLFKISDVKRLIKETNLKFKNKTVYLIQNFDKASTEAQNAFLKRLEEPQENLVFVLTARSEAKILPTIISRVSVVRNKIQKTRNKQSEFFDLDLDSKFLHIDKIKNREEARQFCENLLNSARNSENIKYLEAVNNCLNALNANGNANLQLTKLVLDLTKAP